ncbi:MAG: 3-isopropylmalate dehydratase small subunit [Alphaproteobacteria bacterium]|nr:3-isopropylmalate dehydratase small subunit [Alphaproteobacteria bacterium]
MEKFTRVTGVAVPLMRANIDTDVIVPAKRLVGHQRDELGGFAFEAHRYRPDRTDNPDFVLNQARYRGAKILVTGENFGCGSSRESAVWALAGFGFHCVIAPSFGDIFFNNAFQNGMLLVCMAKDEVERLAADVEGSVTPVMTVNLVSRAITAPSGAETPFEIDAERRQALLEGRDEIGMTLARDAEIRAFQACDRAVRPWIYRTAPQDTESA